MPIRAIEGYPGTADIKSAMASGEVDGACLSRNSYLASFQPADDYQVVLQAGGEGETDLPGVPTAERLVASERGRSLLAIVSTVGVLARYYAVPPGTPATRIESIQSAFDLTMKDEAFLAAAKAAHLEIRPQSPSTVTARMKGLLALPPEFRREVIAMLNEGPS